jgi:hypothetical protein
MIAIENEKVTANPFGKIKLQKENNRRVRYLTDNEEERLLKVLPSIIRWFCWRCIRG